MINLINILADQTAIDHFFLPRGASNLSHDFDWAWNFVLGVSTFFFIVVISAMTFFVIKYRRKGPDTDPTSTVTHNTPLEVMWTGIPLILVMVIFYIGFKGFINYDTPRADCRPITVTASSWKFDFEYPNGSHDPNLYLEKGVPVVLNLHSEDVTHALYIPAFRTQRNAIFGRTTQIWFIPEQLSPQPLGSDPGGFSAFCTQYCGQQHSKMGARVHVLETDAYNKKMVELANPFKTPVDPATGKSQWIPYVKVGEKLYIQNCAQCHSNEANKTIIGPTWKGLWKSKVTFSDSNVPGYTLDDNDSDQKWEDYIRESVLQPAAKIVAGFPNVMPPQGQFAGSEVNDEKLRAIIEYIKSVGSQPYNPKINPTDMPDLFIADKDHPNPPESLAAQKTAATQPGK